VTESHHSRRKILGIAAGAISTAILDSVLRAPLTARGAETQPAGAVPTTGVEQAELASFDRLMHEFVDKHKVVGAALAVTKEGRLVYARGFGFANRDARDPVSPNALFRIASVTKPLTAVAILQLVERGKLKLDDRVAEVLDLKRFKDPRWRQITVLQLLNHTGGWDRAKSFDPMFRSVEIAKHFQAKPPAMPPEILRYMTEQPLDFDPGERYAYSNFGYSVLGRVVERVGKSKYGEYVRREVLGPLGIGRTRLGATLPAGRASGEVHYYDLKNRTKPAVMGKIGERVPLPYGTWCLEAMDSHGGWIASAVDLVRFASAFDVPDQCRILQSASIDTMFARPTGLAGHNADGSSKAFYYGCGWDVRPVGKQGGRNTWHAGSLDGTSSLLVRRHDGLNWAVLFNCRTGADGKELAGAIDGPLHPAASAVTNWPSTNQFDRWL
jgi:N-acyl-D-amino-acid deacylase